MSNSVRLRAFAVGLLGVLLPTWALAADAGRREGRSLEFRADLPWAMLELHAGDDISGVAPLRVPGPLDGDFWLVAKAPGMETQRGRVRIDLDEAGSRLVSYGTAPLHETLMRSVVFPGNAQFRWGEKGKGGLLALTGVAALSVGIWAQVELSDASEDVTKAELAATAEDDPEEKHRLNLLAADAVENESFAKNRRNLCLGAAAVTWGVSLLDAVAFGPEFHVSQADEGSLAVKLEKKRRSSAVMRAFLAPGLGQEYNGHTHKALAAGLGGIGAGVWYLYEQNAYNASVSRYQKVRNRFEQSTTVEERTDLLEIQRVLFDDVEQQDHNRKVALGSVVGVWVLSIIDTAIDFGNTWGGEAATQSQGGLGMYIDPSGAVGARFRF